MYAEDYRYDREMSRLDALSAIADQCEILFSWDDGEGPYVLLDLPSFVAEDEDLLFSVLWILGVAPNRVIWDYARVEGSIYQIFLER